jgi:hypothetical protein
LNTLQIVSRDAAVIDGCVAQELNAVHTMMNKYYGPTDDNFSRVRHQIELILGQSNLQKTQDSDNDASTVLMPFRRSRCLHHIRRDVYVDKISDYFTQQTNSGLPFALWGLSGTG